jgi:inward rectifier potassium channel
MLEQKPENDLGIGSKVTSTTVRILEKDGKNVVTKIGKQMYHPYHTLVEMSWWKFILSIFVFYTIINASFALIYVALGSHTLSGTMVYGFKDNFLKAFFFSIQTFTTVGYGAVAPACWTSNVISSIEALSGLMIFALATGLFYARFSKPQKSVQFSSICVVAPHNGVSALMFRIVNIGRSELIDLKVAVTLSWIEMDEQNTLRRRFQPLTLERDTVSLFPLNWTIVHLIDETSPLWGKSAADMNDMNTDLIVFLRGYDATFGQIVHQNSSYIHEEISWNARFVPMYYPDPKKGMVLELDKLDTVELLTS